MPDSRQLVAIMFADITGFTAMQKDAACALRSRQKLQDNLETRWLSIMAVSSGLQGFEKLSFKVRSFSSSVKN